MATGGVSSSRTYVAPTGQNAPEHRPPARAAIEGLSNLLTCTVEDPEREAAALEPTTRIARVGDALSDDEASFARRTAGRVEDGGSEAAPPHR